MLNSRTKQSQTVNRLQTVPVDVLVLQPHNRVTPNQYSRLSCLFSGLQGDVLFQNRSNSLQASATRDLMTAGLYWFLPELRRLRRVMWVGHWSYRFPQHVRPKRWVFSLWIIVTKWGDGSVTWSWWSKKVLMHALELASQTFTLLSDELRGAERTELLMFYGLSWPAQFILAPWSGNFVWKTASADGAFAQRE